MIGSSIRRVEDSRRLRGVARLVATFIVPVCFT